ncbi:TetR/AcrR family transcriptional regulator [Mycolicibacterium hodleri]|uniref:TetR/AcrR family transcriptional regulator n=1 Tax=Mycolicibacterium hodleri TaxID=49897 RepID=A0A502EFF5_9MYCO|nr:TetR/AcrR family transcriptional regulator [Mycolicibacterium hodleri]TPG36455.1 TetR/AcrR family transcriptional regulator [Mycolicibacterium hodleri]
MVARSDPGARTRRSSSEIRALILTAARDVFSERGYAGASTRELAARAGVAEHLLFRNFGTKAKLFEEAVFVPFEAFISAYSRVWSSRDADGPMTDIALEYVAGLYDFLHANRLMISVLLATRAHEPEFDMRLQQLFGQMEVMINEGITERHFPGVDPALAARLTFGLVLSAAVHQEVLFPLGPPTTREELLSELTQYMLHGLAHRGE